MSSRIINNLLKTALAQELPDPLQTGGEISVIIERLVDALIILGAPVVTIMVLYGAYKIMTAGDSPDKVTEGRKVILYAAIGFAIIIMARGLVFVIAELIGGGRGPTLF